jgi:hypothetical protein
MLYSALNFAIGFFDYAMTMEGEYLEDNNPVGTESRTLPGSYISSLDRYVSKARKTYEKHFGSAL